MNVFEKITVDINIKIDVLPNEDGLLGYVVGYPQISEHAMNKKELITNLVNKFKELVSNSDKDKLVWLLDVEFKGTTMETYIGSLIDYPDIDAEGILKSSIMDMILDKMKDRLKFGFGKTPSMEEINRNDIEPTEEKKTYEIEENDLSHDDMLRRIRKKIVSEIDKLLIDEIEIEIENIVSKEFKNSECIRNMLRETICSNFKNTFEYLSKGRC